MKTRSWSGFRLPCAGLFFAAVAGISLGAASGDISAWIFGAAGAIAAGCGLTRAGRWGTAPAVVLAFACMQVLTSRESASAWLADQLRDGSEQSSVALTVISVPEPAGGPNRWRFVADIEQVSFDAAQISLRCRVMVRWAGDAPLIGERLVVGGELKNFDPPRNPGEFDPERWYALRGIRSEFFSATSGVMDEAGRRWMPLQEFAAASRAWIEGVVSKGIEGTVEQAVILGMTVGDTSDAPEKVKSAFRETGMFHLFSVSGLHVGMIALILGGVLRACGVSTRVIVAILIPSVFAYALLTGLKPASVRAATMISIAVAGMIFDRRPIPLNSLGAAGLVILAFNPNELFNPGFQLSFMVVASILIVAMPAQRWIEARVEPDPFLPRQLIPKWKRTGIAVTKQAAALIAISFAAWLGSLPLIILVFNLFSPIALVTNVVAVPLAFLILSTAMLSLAAGLVWISLAAAINNFNWLLTAMLVAWAQFGAAVPGGTFYVDLMPWTRPKTEVVVFDFRRGGGIVVRSRGATWLIDAGSTGNARYALIPFLRSRGVNRIDGIVLTHGDSRHVAGFEPILESWTPNLLVHPDASDRSTTRRRIESLAADFGIPMLAASAGDRVEISPTAHLQILHPPSGSDQRLADDKGLVILLTAGERRILIMADAGELTEHWMLRHAGDFLDADVVIKGQYPSGESGTSEFVRKIAATDWVVGADSYPPSEQIAENFIARIQRAGAVLHRLDKTGAVTISCEPDSIMHFRPSPEAQ